MKTEQAKTSTDRAREQLSNALELQLNRRGRPGHSWPRDHEPPVALHPTLEDLLLHIVAYRDGNVADAYIALSQLYFDLPAAHQSQRGKRLKRLFRHKLYRGYLEVCDIGFTYVDVGYALFVVDLWPEPASNKKFDVRVHCSSDHSASAIETARSWYGVATNPDSREVL